MFTLCTKTQTQKQNGKTITFVKKKFFFFRKLENKKFNEYHFKISLKNQFPSNFECEKNVHTIVHKNANAKITIFFPKIKKKKQKKVYIILKYL